MNHFLIVILLLFIADIDECSSNPCVNSGACVNAVNGYTCTCAGGYTGDHCETGRSMGTHALVRLVTLVSIVRQVGVSCNVCLIIEAIILRQVGQWL